MRLALLLSLSTPLLFAQSVEVGVEGGIPLTHVFNAFNAVSGFYDESATQRTLPYVVGPKIQIHLWRPLYLDAEGLYSRADYIQTTTRPSVFFGQYKEIVDRWELPILLKAQLNSWRIVHPFVSAGVSLQHSSFNLPLPNLDIKLGGIQQSAIGPTFAVGASFGSRWVRPSLEFRYTRWTNQPIVLSEASVRSKQDEAQILAGLTFGVGKNQHDSTGILEGPLVRRRISLGLKGGLLLTDALSTRLKTTPPLNQFGTCGECGTSRTLPYVFGPALEVHIIGGLSVTAEALYSRADYDHSTEFTGGGSQVYHAAKHALGRWEAPLLLKYSFKLHRLAPFVSAGASLQYNRDAIVRDLSVTYRYFEISPPPPQYALKVTSGPPTGYLVSGPTVGLGTAFDVSRRFRPSVELRYTYWTGQAVVARPPSPVNFCGSACSVPLYPPTIASTHNQVQLLVGIMF
jgi:hypothetical protein